MKNNLNLFIFGIVFFAQSLLGQNTTFNLGYRFESGLHSEYVEKSNSEWTNYSILNDSTAIEYSYNGNEVIEVKYTPKFGSEIYGSMKFDISKYLKFRAGVAVNYFALNYKQIYYTEDEVLTGFDTITSDFSGYYTESDCDVYINEIPVEEINKGRDLHIVSLKVPVELIFNVYKDKLNIGAGAFISTPIYSDLLYNSVYVESNEVDGENQCKYVLVEQSDKSGSDLENFNLGINVAFI
ncbi:MAG: hypothetical protein R2771_15075 [Saprospiraceae bacterium]